MQDSSKKCFCKAEFDIEVGCDDTPERLPRHQSSGFAGATAEGVAEAVQNLMESQQVTSIHIDIDAEGNSQLSFSTIEGVCASQLGYYLIFQEG